MRADRPKRSEQLMLTVEPELRSRIEAEAWELGLTVSSTLRMMIRAQLATMPVAPPRPELVMG